MPEEAPDEDEVEAEMPRMMQDEAEGDEGDGGEDAGDPADPLAAPAGDGGDDPENVDDMLEQEMVRAIQEEDSPEDGGGLAPAAPADLSGAMSAFAGGLAGTPESAEGIDRLAEIDVTVTVELGGALVPIKDILSWQSEEVVQLEPEEHEPVDVLVNGRLFARGEVVVVGDTFGVKIIELFNPPEEA